MKSSRHGSSATFGEIVQDYLRASGYLQKQLADELGLHPKVLSRKLNGTADAHLTQQEVWLVIKILAGWCAITTREEALHLLKLAQMDPATTSPEEWQSPPLSYLATARTQSPGSGTSGFSHYSFTHNLPPPSTRLIGREWAVDRLRQLLGRDEVRLLTLVGAGGSGKTRLALYVAHELSSDFEHGAWLVALAGVSEAEQVPMSIMSALNIQSAPGIAPVQSLVAYLRTKHLLLLLDNFEQLGAATAVVDEILATAPGVKMMVTSRAVLHLYGEHEFSVPPLDVPDLSISLDTAELAQYGAVQLFVERAQALVPDFTLTAANAADIAQICARADGLPLALELAAARIKVLSPALLLEQLSLSRLPLLSAGAKNLPSRQQTLRNTMVWSYDLLSANERAWFARLGVFNGSWSLEAAQAMMQAVAEDQAGGAVTGFMLDILKQLIDNSLLARLPDSAADKQVRFSMLETLHEFALEQLSAQCEFERLRDWHARYYMELAEAAELGFRGPQQLSWLSQLIRDHANLQAAFEWSLQRARVGMSIAAPTLRVEEPSVESEQAIPAVEVCLRLVAALRPYWEWRGYLNEGRSQLGAALALPLVTGASRSVLAARAKALSEAARLVCLQNDQQRSLELAEESIALWRQLQDANGLATALLHRGWAAHALGEYELAKQVYREGLERISPAGDSWLRAQLLFYLAAAAGFTSDFEQMHSCYAQSKELFEQVGDKSAVADLLKDQGGITILEGKYSQAIDYLLTSVKMCYELGHRQFVATCMGSLSFAFGMRGEPEPALASIYSARLGGAADGLMDAVGLTPWTRTNPLALAVRQYIRSQVDEQSYETAWSEGRKLTAEQAIELAQRLAGAGPF